MGNTNDLFTSLKMFSEGVKSLSLQRTIAGANEKVHQIKSSELKEEEKRAQMMGVANDMAAQLYGMGVPATSVMGASQAMMPQLDPITASEQRRGQAVEDREDEQSFRSNEAALNRNAQLEAAGIRSNRKMPKLSDTHVNAFADALAQEQGLRGLLKDVQSDPGLTGPLDSNLPGRGELWDKKFGKFKMKSKQLFNQYRKLITGAGASTREIKMLMESFPTGGEADEVYQEKVNGALDVGRSILNTRIQALEAQGHDTSRLQGILEGGGPQSVPINPNPANQNMSGADKRNANRYIK